MVYMSSKIEKIAELIDKGKYFTINRSRQYGKTTTMLSLENKLKSRMQVISISFEGAGDVPFSTDKEFVKMLIPRMAKAMKFTDISAEDSKLWGSESEYDQAEAVQYLSDKITELCEKYEIVPKAAIAQKAIPNSNLAFVHGSVAKDDLNNYFNVLLSFDKTSR